MNNLSDPDNALPSFLSLADSSPPSWLSVNEPKKSFGTSSKNAVKLSDTFPQKKTEISQRTTDLASMMLMTKTDGNRVIFRPIKELTKEEVEVGLADNSFGMQTETVDGVVFKFHEQQIKKFESLGINSFELHSNNEVKTYTSFNLQTLSDNELDLLTTHVKAYLIFLKMQADPDDKKTAKTIHDLEFKLKYLEIEKAIRTSDPKLKDLLDGFVELSPYKVAMKLEKLWSHQKAVKQEREKAAEQKFLETKHIIISKEIFRSEAQVNIIGEAVIKNDVNSHDIINGVVKQKTANKNLVDICRFINIHHNL